MATYKGNDVSYCQEGLDMAKLKANKTEWVIIRAGIAESKDVTCDGFVKSCANANMPYGFYWYAYATTTAEAKREAAACIKVIKAFNPVLPIFYDVERGAHYNLSDKAATALYVTFCEEIKKAGFKPGIYVNPSMWNKLDKTAIKSYDVWLAHYNSAFPAQKSSYLSKTGAKLWQYGTEKVVGYEVDVNEGYEKYWNTAAPLPPDPVAPTLQKGDKATVNKGAKFSDGTKPMSFVYSTVFDVQRISKDLKEALIGLDGCATGWFYIKDLKKSTAAPAPTFKVGDKVGVKQGAKTYDNKSLASWVYTTVFDVLQVNGDRVVIGLSGQVTAAVNSKDLIKK